MAIEHKFNVSWMNKVLVTVFSSRINIALLQQQQGELLFDSGKDEFCLNIL